MCEPHRGIDLVVGVGRVERYSCSHVGDNQQKPARIPVLCDGTGQRRLAEPYADGIIRIHLGQVR
ncbi:hypothetical protein [Streptomyces sp. WM6378]|uniref:hypothetical protein n=1 Tax=Streptomyces sp. WM6378 TaxID=1415557 RepID=UPI0018FE8AA3|nr:hypothetical protein [Streptomyces sp. WM6378]